MRTTHWKWSGGFAALLLTIAVVTVATAGPAAATRSKPARALEAQAAQSGEHPPEVVHTGTGPTGYEVTFHYYAPSATKVEIRGEWGLRSVGDATTRPPSEYRPGDFFNEALISDMELDPATGVWSYTTPLPPGTWNYQFRPTPCDDCPTEFVQDPSNPTFNQTSPTTWHGSYEPLSQVYVPQDPEFSPDGRPLQAPVPQKLRGRLTTLRYTSPTTTTCATVVLCSSPAGTHDVAIYTPPGYKPNRGIPYPTLYLSHGGGGNEIDWFTQGAANEIFDNLIRLGTAQPFVAVATDFNGIPAVDGSVEEGYVQDLRTNVIPLVESKYNVSGEANDRAFAGLSAGGARTGRLLFQYSEEFGYYASWSSTDAFGPTVDFSAPAARTRLALHVGIGRQDPRPARHEGLDRLATTDIPFVRDDVNGVHSWDVWRQLLGVFAADHLFAHTTTSVAVNGRGVVATVRPSTTERAAPTGTVDFLVDGLPIGKPVQVKGSKARVAIPASLGHGVVTAQYSGDRYYRPSIGKGDL